MSDVVHPIESWELGPNPLHWQVSSQLYQVYAKLYPYLALTSLVDIRRSVG